MKALLPILFLCTIAHSPIHADGWDGKLSEPIAAVQKKAQAGEPEAMALIAYYSRYGMEGVPVDADLAYKYSHASAKAGNSFGMAVLASCVNHGSATRDADYFAVYPWAKKSYDKGHPLGAFMLGICYEHGFEVERDFDKARELQIESAQKGCLNGRFAMTTLNNLGEKMPNQLPEMVTLAFEDGYPAAARRISYLLREKKELTAQEEDYYDKAIAMIRENRDLGSLSSRYYLALHNKTGKGDDAFFNEMIHLARLGYSRAYEFLFQATEGRYKTDDGYAVYTSDGFHKLLGRRSIKKGNIALYYDAAIDGLYIKDGQSPADLKTAELCTMRRLRNPEGRGESHHTHAYFAELHWMAMKAKNDELAKPELAIAHAQYSARDNPFSAFIFPRLLHRGYGYCKIDNVRAYATILSAKKLGRKTHVDKKLEAEIRETLSEKELKQAEELAEQDFPFGDKWLKEAHEILKKYGRENRTRLFFED